MQEEMERWGVGLTMNDVFKDLYISMKGKKSAFNFLSDDDFENLSSFFESDSERIPRSLLRG